MQTIGMLAQKGGVGKTTLALHWAVCAQQSGSSAAIIDADTQGSAASWGRRRQHDTPAVLEVDPHGQELSQAIEACRNGGIAFTFIDTMPRIEAPSAQAARLSDLVVIPCGPTVLDIEAIGATIDIAQGVGARPVIVLNQCRHSSGINDQAAETLSDYGLPVCPVHIKRRAALEDAFIDGRAVNEVEPSGRATDEIRRSWLWLQDQLES